MSSESMESDVISSQEDIELTEFARNNSDLGSSDYIDPATSIISSDSTTSRRVSFQDPLEGSSTRTVSFQDPLNSSDLMEGSSSSPVSVFGSAEDSSTDDESHGSETDTNENRDTGYWSRIKHFLKHRSKQVRNSVYYPWLVLAMLTLPYSAGYMGCKHFYLCQGCPALPQVVYASGLFGIFLMSLHFFAAMKKCYFRPPLSRTSFLMLRIFLYMGFYLCVMIEAVTFISCTPAFFPTEKMFCLKTFYNYVFYANIAMVIVHILLILINGPRLLRYL